MVLFARTLAPASSASVDTSNEGKEEITRCALDAQRLDPRMNMNTIFDIAIIGAGAVGSAIARELSRYELNIVLLESNPDVGMGTSKASTAIWHTGYDATPGSL